VLVIRQDQYEVQKDLLAADGWTRETLNSPDDELVLLAFGLRCSLKDIYKGTTMA
jgi:hypothetical protein